MIAILMAGVQLQVANYQNIVDDRPLLSGDYPSHYTSYKVSEDVLSLALRQWPHYSVNEKQVLISRLSKVTGSAHLSEALLKIFHLEKSLKVKSQILSTLVYMEQSASSLKSLEKLVKDKTFSLDAFTVLAKNSSAEVLKPYLNKSDEYVIVACLSGKVDDARLLMKVLSRTKAEYKKELLLKQLARINENAAYKKCENDFQRSKFIASSHSSDFLVKQSRLKQFAVSAFLRMSELEWNKSFNDEAKRAVLNANDDIKLAACSVLVEKSDNREFLLSRVYKLPIAAGVLAIEVFSAEAIPASLHSDFCTLEKGADAINLAKLAVMEDQAMEEGKDSVLNILKHSTNPDVTKACLRYLGVMKYRVDSKSLKGLEKKRQAAFQQGLIFYLAAVAKDSDIKGLVKYTQTKDMTIRQAFFDGVAHNPKTDFSKLIQPGLKSRKDQKKNTQPSSAVRAYMIWAMTNSDHVNNRSLFELKKLITEKLVKVPLSENTFDPSYVRENAYLCLAHWAKQGSSEAKRMFKESKEFVEWQKEVGEEYRDSFDQVVDMAEAMLIGKEMDKSYFYSKTLSTRMIDRPIR
ncbi:hypothetical protein PQO03_08130 [Lentisphaera profundi]|uniref:HEAT repeat domain-containing protein n=1 Tax=Lentisphaera profundi TaxID=1658616 RepID=A0ABY7VU90_9BACT|nr:hypothetical protein [Lentisphaera profundi]WDE95683.1 hypothetical protein PQO03_08130 [Lentisphaera profundi]